MSRRSNAPYDDEILSDGISISYEGHDAARTNAEVDPKTIDQPHRTKSGKLTQNGLFAESVVRLRSGGRPDLVKVYEKLFSGVWSYRGTFLLKDYAYGSDSRRKVFKFILELAQEEQTGRATTPRRRTRIIPTEVKREVWERDGGRCVKCGATDELHFDHNIPYSLGGTSISAENVQLLCARHNLKKGNKLA